MNPTATQPTAPRPVSDWSDPTGPHPAGEGPQPGAAAATWKDWTAPTIPHDPIYISPPPYTEADGETPTPSEHVPVDD